MPSPHLLGCVWEVWHKNTYDTPTSLAFFSSLMNVSVRASQRQMLWTPGLVGQVRLKRGHHRVLSNRRQSGTQER